MNPVTVPENHPNGGDRVPKPNHQNKTRRPASPGVREVALDILCRVEKGAYADRLLEAYRHAGLNPADRGLLQELVLGTVTWRGAIDYFLSPYLKMTIRRLSPCLRNLLRLSVYQIRYLDRIPGYAVVSEAVDLARRREGQGRARLVNAVLRGVTENRRPVRHPEWAADAEGYLSVCVSHPGWLVRRWIARFGPEETRVLCESNNVRPAISIRVNRLRTTPERLRAELEADGICAEPASLIEGYLTILKAGPLFQTRAFSEGRFTVQGQGAGLAVRLLDPQPGEHVLDLCSAPGGKATAAAEGMADRGLILALDARPARLRTVRQNLQRLGLHSVRAIAANGCASPTGARFHRVLVDAPCSALGILNHHPELRWRRRASDLGALSELQRDLLNAAADCVRPDGVLVYSTCTLEPEENEEIVRGFLNARADFSLEAAGDILGRSLAGDYLQILPHRHGCDGAFAARLRRTGFLGVEPPRNADNT